MVKPERLSDAVTLYEGDCLDVLPTLADSSVDLIATDPPYHKVKGEEWDRQWKTDDDYLAWLGCVADKWRRVLKPNGSLYCFASPRMAARVEVLIGERFNVLNRITWAKPEPTSEINYGASNGGRMSKEAMRRYYPNTEAIIFAEHYGAEGYAKGEAGYGAKCDELRGFVFEPLRAYLDGERIRAGFTPEDCNVACGHRREGGMAGRHYFSASQWCLPTAENYAKLRVAFCRVYPHNFLWREYEDLRREYEDLRREYEDLRRPFTVSADVPCTDVWTFQTVNAYKGKHPCEKPMPMMKHIVNASSRLNGVVLDTFAGSGSTAAAAQSLGRKCILIEKDPKYCDIIRRRIADAEANGPQSLFRNVKHPDLFGELASAG